MFPPEQAADPPRYLAHPNARCSFCLFSAAGVTNVSIVCFSLLVALASYIPDRLDHRSIDRELVLASNIMPPCEKRQSLPLQLLATQNVAAETPRRVAAAAQSATAPGGQPRAQVMAVAAMAARPTVSPSRLARLADC